MTRANDSSTTPIDKRFSESDLTVGRAKSRSLPVSATYRLTKLARVLVGRQRLLGLSLDAAWLTRRIAFELSGEVFGAPFHIASLGLSEQFLRAWVPPNARVLDVGCGTGRWSRLVAPHAQHVVGIDHSARDVAAARASAAREGLSNVEYVVGDVTTYLSEHPFDAALLVHLLEHIEPVDEFLRRIAAVTPLVIVEVPDFEADASNRIRVILGRRFTLDDDHVREYTAETLRLQLERCGWRVIHEERRNGCLLAVAKR